MEIHQKEVSTKLSRFNSARAPQQDSVRPRRSRGGLCWVLLRPLALQDGSQRGKLPPTTLPLCQSQAMSWSRGHRARRWLWAAVPRTEEGLPSYRALVRVTHGRSAGRAQRAKRSCWQPEVGHIHAQQGQFWMPFAGKKHPLIRHLLAALSLGHWVTELGPGSLDKMTFSIGDFWLFFSLFPPHNKLNPFTCHFEVCITGYLGVRISSSPQLGMKPSTHIQPFVVGRL